MINPQDRAIKKQAEKEAERIVTELNWYPAQVGGKGLCRVEDVMLLVQKLLLSKKEEQ